MAKRQRRAAAPKTLLGADEFAGPDADRDALEKIAAARAAATKEEEADRKNGDNGGPVLDADAWMSATNQYMAEMLEMEDIDKHKAEVAGRISSIRKIAKKRGVDWDLVKRYHEDHKRIRKGAMGAMVTEERRYRWLLKAMGSPLGTQFTLWEIEPETADGAEAKPGMDAELQGQHSFSNSEPLTNNPFNPGTQEHVDWGMGWKAAQTAAAQRMDEGNAEILAH